MNQQPTRSFTKNEFRVETMRGQGPGGQKRNVTDSCVRITHIESGLTAQNCDTPSQHRNKEAAFRQLASKLIEHFFPKTNDKQDQTVVIRSYKQDSNLVVDQCGFKTTYHEVDKNGLDQLIKQRKKKVQENNNDNSNNSNKST